MTNHISIHTNGKPLSLPEDFSLDLEYKNPLFNDAESYSYPAQIPLDGNRHFVQNIEDRRSPLRPTSVENTKARIYAEGLPVFDGKIKVGDGEELTSSLSLNVEGGNTLRDLIADLECKDIPVKDTIIIGQKVGTLRVQVLATPYARVNRGDGEADIFLRMPRDNYTTIINPQALGFSCPLNINTDLPYPAMPYCNARVAYKHYGIDDQGNTSDSVQEGEYGPYMVLDADRQQSGVCFYVLYFLDCLFDYLGLEWDNSALMQIEDLTRLCFYTTKCSYDEVNDTPIKYITSDDFNKEMETRGCGSKLVLHSESVDNIKYLAVPENTEIYEIYRRWGEAVRAWKTIQLKDNVSFMTHKNTRLHLEGLNEKYEKKYRDYCNLHETTDFYTESISSWWENVKINHLEYNYCDMAANSGNFPDESVTTILDSLENMFGIRFVYDAEAKKVTARLLRDIFRSDVPVREFRGTINSMNKISETTTGVYVGYSAESDEKEQRNNLRDKIRDYDTSFDYVDYPSPTEHNAEGLSVASTTKIIEGAYAQIVSNARINDNTLYIDSLTGNRYRTKVDSEATKSSELKPVWFQVAQFKGVAFGNCSKSNEENIVRITTDFLPVILSDVNAAMVRSNCASGTPASMDKDMQPLLVPFCDEDMEHEYVMQILDFPISAPIEGLSVYMELRMLENYDVSSSEDGNSPLQSYDWGLTIAIMRGGGSDATTQTYDNNFDGFGNYRYRTVSGRYALTADTMDMLGNEYDYNGVQEGLGRGERFSLFPRAYATPDWAPDGIYTAPDGKQIPLCRDDVHTEVTGAVLGSTSVLGTTAPEASPSSAVLGTRVEHTYYRNRGWVDRFLYDYAEWLLSRRKFNIRALCSVSMLLDIRNHWFDHWLINGERGIINQVSVTINNATGMEEVQIEFFTL